MGLLSADDEADGRCAVERVPVLPYRPDSEFLSCLLDNGTEQQSLSSPSLLATSDDLEPRPPSFVIAAACVIFILASVGERY